MTRMHPDDIAALARALAAELRVEDDGGFCALDPLPSVVDGGLVYFARCSVIEGPIKIGIATDLARRRNTLQIGCPWPIAIVAYYWSKTPGDEESALHERFADERMRGEWFRPSPRLIDLVTSIARLRIDGPSRVLRGER